MKPGISKLILTLLIGLCCPLVLKAQYTINSVAGNLAESDTMTRGQFIVWWDKDFNYSNQVDQMLDTMLVYRNDCLENLGMEDPTGSQNGYYANIYIHTPGSPICYYSTNYPEWGNGVGADPNGYAFMTLPNFVLGDWPNLAHETFHIFQSRGMWDVTPGIYNTNYGGWFVEATAEWYALRRYPNDVNAFVDMEILVRIPQVPIWLDFYNSPSSYPNNWQRDVHQYALSIFLYYLTNNVELADDMLSSYFYSGSLLTPQEYLFDQVGDSKFREEFVNCMAHLTNDFDLATPPQAKAANDNWNQEADPIDDNRFVKTFINNGTNGWYSPTDESATSAWSFNTYKLTNTKNETYVFEINGDALGTLGDLSFFQGTVVVQNSTSGTSFHHLVMENNTQGSLILNLTPNDTSAYFIIASMPSVFVDYVPFFQIFGYDMRISTGSITATSEVNDGDQKSEIARYNLLGQKIESSYCGLQIIQYYDGSSEKVLIQR